MDITKAFNEQVQAYKNSKTHNIKELGGKVLDQQIAKEQIENVVDCQYQKVLEK